MAQQPLLLTIGLAFAVGYAAMELGEHLDARYVPGETAPPVARLESSSARGTPAPARISGERPTLTVSADLRGQFTVHPSMEGFSIRMLVDTGASVVALRHEDAASLGVRPAPGDYKIKMQTANGTVRAARITLREVRLGEISVRNVDAVVLPPGALGVSLLGTSFLARLQSYEVKTGRLILRG